MNFHHFLLTRFNLPLWTEDKHGHSIDRSVWLEGRLRLFEKYCLPSVCVQIFQDFTWILLCDENTPLEYRERIKEYRKQCPQIELIQVEEGYAWDFPNIFSEIVTSILEEKGAQQGDICMTTQLDNDDALHKDYLSEINKEINTLCRDSVRENPIFLSYDYGLQYFTNLNMATKVKYPNNHFMTCVESVHKANDGIASVGTCFGYGSHFLIEKNLGMNVHHIVDKSRPMWCEVIHKDNVDNDVKMTFDTEIVRDLDIMRNEFNVDTLIQVNLFSFAIKGIGQVFRRTKGKFIKRRWR